MRRLRWVLISSLLITLLLAGCGGDGDDDEGGPANGQDLRLKIAADLIAGQEENSVTFTDAEADCVAEEIVDQIGTARLQELGVEETQVEELELTAAEHDEVFEAFDDCLDLEAQVAKLFTSDGTLTEDVARCVADRYTDSPEFHSALTTNGSDPELNGRIDTVINDAVAACGG